MKLSAIANALGARLEHGSPDVEITGLNGIEQAGPGELTFVSNPKYSAAAKTTKASAVIVGEDFPVIPAAMLRAKDPYLTFARALELFHQPLRYAPGVHPTAVVHASARIGPNAHIGPYVVIDEDVVIGANAVLLAHVVIYRGVKIGDNFFAHAHSVVRENCRIGNNVLLQNGVVIGADGFGFAKTAEEPLAQDSATGSRGDRGRRGSAGQFVHRPRQRRRNAHRTRGQGRQPCAGRPRITGRRRRVAVRAGRAGRIVGDRQPRHSYWTSRRGRALQGRRRCDRDPAEWRGPRHPRRRHSKRRPCGGS